MCLPGVTSFYKHHRSLLLESLTFLLEFDPINLCYILRGHVYLEAIYVQAFVDILCTM